MSWPEYREVDPRTLYVATQRLAGADPGKLHRQIAKYGSMLVGMPPIEVEEDPNGDLRIRDGMTRATRAAKLSPNVLVRVAIVGKLKRPIRNRITINDVVP